MSGKQRLASILMSIVMLLGMAALSVSAEAPAADVYVSAGGGNDTENDGSVNSPFATLAKAVDAAKDGATIYVMSDLTMTECARFYDKHLTITSYGDEVYTITRGDEFSTKSDNARSWYNPAMIEVGSEFPETVVQPTAADDVTAEYASLRLENIILDDAGRFEGDVFAQAVNKDGSVESRDNLVYVQDAMIASYSGSGTITLGEGAVLRNFGGMSAVRVTDGSKVIMESGSVIEDTTVTDRTKGAAVTNDDLGAAGAIWLQDGIFEMKNGAQIRNLIGRAVYADPGDIKIDGKISDITADDHMWQKKAGAAIHLRNEGGSAVLSANALIENLSSGGSAVWVQDGELTVQEGAVLRNMNMVAINIKSSKNGSTAYIDGEIYGITSNGINNQALNINEGHNDHVTIGPNAKIHDNVVWYGTIYMQGVNAELHVYGKIYNNYSTDRGGAISVSNNFKPNALYLYDGAEIYNNFSKQTGGGIMITSGLFTMYGGKIYDNTALLDGGGVYVRKGGSFIMKGGSITGNKTAAYGGGVAYDVTEGTVYAELNGGTVSGNYMESVITSNDKNVEYEVTSDGRSNDIGIGSSNSSNMEKYLLAKEGANIGNKDFYFKKKTFFLDYTDASGMKLGNTVVDLAAAAEELSWDDPLVTFWAQTDAAAEVTLKEITFDPALPVYAILQPVDASGAAENDAIVANAAVSDSDIILTVPASENGYAIAIVQPTEDYGTVTVTGTPAIIYEDDTPKQITVTVTYEISENLKSMMTQNQDIDEITITLMPDARLSADDDQKLTETVALAEKITKTFTLTLPDGNFANGDSLVTTAMGSIVIDRNQNTAIIPGNQLSTTMKTPARYDVTYRWENAPAGVTLPNGANDLREGSLFTVDSTYTEGYEVETEEGTCIFSGWSRTGTITVNGNITITGSWRLDGETEDEENSRYMFLWLTGFVKLYAEDAEDETRLPGAVYELHKLGKRGRFMDTYTTDENGEIYLKHLTIGDYVLIQTAAPEGYELDSEPIEFTVRVAKLLELVDHCEQIDAEEQD